MPNNPNSSLDDHEDRIKALEAILHPMIQHPIGAITVYSGTNPPLGWCLCDGRTLASKDYPDLYKVIGTTYGGNSTNFKIPDLRGYFVRALDNSKGIDSGRTLGSVQGDAIRNITGYWTGTEAPGYYTVFGGAVYKQGPGKYHGINGSDWDNERMFFDASRVVPTAAENRPKNIAMNYIIKIAQIEGLTPNKDMLDAIMAELATKLGANGSVIKGDLVVNGTITATKVYGSVWNDYAEWYDRGEQTQPGDIISLDPYSDAEKYVKARAGSRVVGVHSDSFGHIIGGDTCIPAGMDYESWNREIKIPVGVSGRVFVNVIGPVKKGDIIYLHSELAGIGTTEKSDGMPSVGFAVTSKSDVGIGKVRINIELHNNNSY